MKTPISDIIDRYTILMLKMEQIDNYLPPKEAKKEKPFLKKEIDLYKEAIKDFRKEGVQVENEWINGLYKINAKCQEMESDIRREMGKALSKEKLKKVGRSATLLPKFNKQRIAIKNEIAKKHNIRSKRVQMPLAELIDRFTILKLKNERVNDLTPDQIANEKPFLKKELALYKRAIDGFRRHGIKIKKEWIEKLYDNNRRAWDMESALRHEKEKKFGLEEFGRRAIKLRHMNIERIAIKNEIAEKSKSGFKEVKIFLK
ncbi:MAG: hypothetical protein Q7S34_02340 [bacterium]|nr:hypothetical protein [bacterium]